ncbi:hypothetical protein SCARR_00247 [Pontiella sulfatireligans]|uniref:Uncharacterized protein n=1 Tax=Pontiella sulfatireligans TaxID=2750658 RepID=A0A6C2UG58_9BACT|nr:hypothetical protein SCARR_00247 [Pontiella sulfatireligans]
MAGEGRTPSFLQPSTYCTTAENNATAAENDQHGASSLSDLD